MKALQSLAVAVIFSLASVPAYAEAQGQTGDSPCTDISFTLWTNSSHPGGNKQTKHSGLKFNERNRGVGFKCYFQKENPWFAHLDGLENSKFGSTLSAGFGKEYGVQIGPIKTYAGASLSLTYYEIRARVQITPGEFIYRTTGEVILPHPGVHYGVGLNLGEALRAVGVRTPFNLGTISFEEQRLLGNIKLRSLGWQYKHSF